MSSCRASNVVRSEDAMCGRDSHAGREASVFFVSSDPDVRGLSEDTGDDHALRHMKLEVWLFVLKGTSSEE
jgi:hypothetical protein